MVENSTFYFKTNSYVNKLQPLHFWHVQNGILYLLFTPAYTSSFPISVNDNHYPPSFITQKHGSYNSPVLVSLPLSPHSLSPSLPLSLSLSLLLFTQHRKLYSSMTLQRQVHFNMRSSQASASSLSIRFTSSCFFFSSAAILFFSSSA